MEADIRRRRGGYCQKERTANAEPARERTDSRRGQQGGDARDRGVEADEGGGNAAILEHDAEQRQAEPQRQPDRSYRGYGRERTSPVDALGCVDGGPVIMERCRHRYSVAWPSLRRRK
nr:hypothetical protein [Aureimonas sp. AU22]